MPGTGPINVLYHFSGNATGLVQTTNQAKGAMDGMVTHAQGVHRKLATTQNGLFNSTAQWGFALQDVITVLSMGGGMSRALLSAANNLSFIASAAGTIKGFFLGIAITVGAAVLPKIFEWLTAQRQIADEVERARRAAQHIGMSGQRRAQDARFSHRLEDAAAEGRQAVEQLIEDQQRDIESLHEDIAGQRNAIAALENELQAAREGRVMPGDDRDFSARGWEAGLNNIWPWYETALEQWESATDTALSEARAAMEGDLRQLVQMERQLQEAQNTLDMVPHDPRIENAEELRDLEREILQLRERQTDLAMAGSVEEANARQRATRTAFDTQVMGQQRDNEEVHRLIRQLNAALAGGIKLVAVR